MKIARRPRALPRLAINSSTAVLAALGLIAQASLAQGTAPLPAGTLPVLRGVVSGAAVLRDPVTTAGGRLLHIDQSSNRAIIDWRSFDIASGSEVRFNQPSSTASALNRIYSRDPSVIQGRLSANGQVLLINQNGILFDRGAQVNVQSLAASTLNMSNERFLSGALTTGALASPAFEGRYDDAGTTVTGGAPAGSIVLGAGGAAAAAAPRLDAAAGGQLLLIAPRIDNQGGVLRAPDGQVILAAGAKAYLALADASETTLRGFQVEIQAAPDSDFNISSFVRNAGEISADRGNVTLAALAVNQAGRVNASTAIQANGSVFLKARTRDGDAAGRVSLAAGSRTEVMPDAEDKATLAESQSFADRRGEIRVDGKTIVQAGSVQAAGGRITLNAADAASPALASTEPARVYFAEGSSTSVAGAATAVAFEANLLTFKVTSNELKDAPDQKTGVLRGATVTVDLRRDNPILDLSGYRGAQARTVAQKAADGGELVVASSGELILRQGATLDASGGRYDYGAGTAATSQLLGADGRLYDISTAAAERSYTALLDSDTRTSARWGQTTVLTGLLAGLGKVEPGYAEGRAAGAITLLSRGGLVLDGTMNGGVTVGPNQLARAPRGASLVLGRFDALASDFDAVQRIGSIDLVARAGNTLGAGFGADSVMAAERAGRLTLGLDQLFGNIASAARSFSQTGFGSIELNSNGRITLASGVAGEAAPGTALLLRAPQIDIAGSLALPAGSVTLQPVATLAPVSERFGLGRNSVTLRSTAAISTHGLWLNNASADGSAIGGVLPSARLNVASDGSTSTSSLLDGGRIVIGAGDGTSATLLERGSTLDASGGAALSAQRRVSAGSGGSIAIANGESAAASSDWLQARLSAFGVGNGGSLTLSTPRIAIEPAGTNGTLPTSTTRLAPSLFTDFGFSRITLNSTQGLTVGAGTALKLEQRNLFIDPLAVAGVATGEDIGRLVPVQRLADDLRRPVNLTLAGRSAGLVQQAGTVTLERGATIQADPRAQVTLSSSNGLQVLGRIDAPSGQVSLLQNAAFGVDTPDLQLGPDAQVSVAAAFVPKPNAAGLVQGTVIDAGSLIIAAVNSGLALAVGSRLDLSGRTQTVQVLDAEGTAVARQRQLDGNAGTLVLRSQGNTVLGSTLQARAGSAQGAGGSFALELKAADGALSLPAESRIVLRQGPGTTGDAGDTVDAQLSVNALAVAGFDKLRLLSENRIAFQGDVAMDFRRGIRLDAPLIDLVDGARVNLASASSVALGQSLDPRGGSGAVEAKGRSPVLATRAGGGLLSARSGTIDLFGSLTVNGVAETRLFADGDLRLTGRVVNGTPDTDRAQGTSVGAFTSAGSLTLNAAQVYPTTRTDFSLQVKDTVSDSVLPGGFIVVGSNGRTPADAFTAGGRVTLQADTLVQSGVLRAPLGAIVLDGASRVELSAGSVTSVSAQGLTLPFGFTRAGLDWAYQDNIAGGTANLLTTASADAKRIELRGRALDVQAGATVDISAGGDLQALEFVPGSGGTRDTLVQPDTFAIIPTSRLSSMPVDPDTTQRYTQATARDIGLGLQSTTTDTNVYDRLRIGAGAAVPAGEYVLLPGRYALLPGAFLVQIRAGGVYADLQPGETVALPNGQTLVAGRRVAGGTAVAQSDTVGVLVRPGSAATRESDYTISTASYFTELALRQGSAVPRTSADAGRLSFDNAETLSLAGRFLTGTQGRLAEVDVAASRIAVVERTGAAGLDGFLQVGGAALSSFGGSLLVGGRRSEDGSRIATAAQELVVANGDASALVAPEVLLAATDRIDVRSGSVVAGRGSFDAPVTVYRAEAGGALLRAAGGRAVTLDRGTSIDGARGEIQVAAGATLAAQGALLLDATRTTRSAGTLSVARGGSLSLASAQVSLGETAGVAGLDTGLVLSNADLTALAGLDALVIKGYQGIDLFGAARVGNSGLGSLTLDTGALRGQRTTAGTAAVIRAAELRLQNTGAAAVAGSAGAGTVSFEAERLVVGAGDKVVSGYGQVDLRAGTGARAEGQGSLALAGNATLSTPQLDVAAGAAQQWQAPDGAMRLRREGPAPAVAAADAGAGGRLSLSAREVEVATAVRARAGSLSLTATGTAGEGVRLAEGADLDASGASKDFRGNLATADAGRVALSAATGAVSVNVGAQVRLGAETAGSEAGQLDIKGARLDLRGTLQARGGAPGAGGLVRLDLGELADFSGLNAALAAGGFDRGLDLRLRRGDITVAAGDTVRAQDIQIAADGGRIDLRGTLDASAASGGGRVRVWAGTGLGLADGASVRASGTSADASAAAPVSAGGNVTLSTNSGRLEFASGASIDVGAGAKGAPGSVTFRVARDAGNRLGEVALDGRIAGNGQVRDFASGADVPAQAEVVLEANRVYTATGTLSPASYAADHAAFMRSAAGSTLLAGLRDAAGGAYANTALRGSTEIRGSGDLAVTTAWDLTTANWLTGAQPGTLTLRAAGNVRLTQSIGLPSDTLRADRSWSLRLAGGADLGAANPLATVNADATGLTGNVVLDGNNAKLRTGTGAIEVAAATDFRMNGLQSVVMSTGRIGAADTATNGNNRWSTGGGDIGIRAGRDAVGASDEWLTEWLRRTRSTTVGAPAEWWVYRTNFQQGVGTLAGGDLGIEAGGSVRQLSAMVPTTGRSTGAGTLDVQGGGDLRVTAGADLDGGAYLVARGSGQLRAGGTLGGSTPTQLYLMGVSSGNVPAKASLQAQAGGSLTLQAVANPTAMHLNNSACGTVRACSEPSFGTSGTTTTFFSYAADSALELTALSGNLTLGSTLTLGRGLAGNTAPLQVPAALPARVRAVALAGDIAGTNTGWVSFPSATGSINLLAAGSIRNLAFSASELQPAAVATAAQPSRSVSNRQLTGADLATVPDASANLIPTTAALQAPRLIARDGAGERAFDLQALTGDIVAVGNATTVGLPAASRVEAGGRIDNVAFVLQNLRADDLSLLRADTGDILSAGVEIRGPGRLLVQAGRNVDLGASNTPTRLGGLVATGNNANASLANGDAARITVLAGVTGGVNLGRLDAAYTDIVALNNAGPQILDLYRALNAAPDRALVRSAADLPALIAAENAREAGSGDKAYGAFQALAARYPQLLARYQATARAATLPLDNVADASAANALYRMLNAGVDSRTVAAAPDVATALKGVAGAADIERYSTLVQRYPRLFTDYQLRRSKGGLPEGVTPILFSDLLAGVADVAIPAAQVGSGNVFTYLSSIQSYGNGSTNGQGSIDLWAPGGGVLAGLTTPAGGTTIGVLTNAGGAIRSVVRDDFSINQGKVLTAQGGDILIYSVQGSIDAGRGARTSLSTPPPTRTPVIVDGVVVGFLYSLPASAGGSGIQTLSSDPDGVGPRPAPPAGSIVLSAPGGTVDAGEAGIRSGGNIVVVANTVRNADSISASGSSQGVPKVESGSLATSLASSGGNTATASRGEEAAAAAATARAQAASAAAAVKPTVLSVEVLGFGDRNCREDDKDCFSR